MIGAAGRRSVWVAQTLKKEPGAAFPQDSPRPLVPRFGATALRLSR